MKKTMKYLVKLLFVIILPLVVSISTTYLVISNWEDTSVMIIIAFAILTSLTMFNAVFYSAVLSNTKLLPEITVETGLVVGFCIAYDRNRMKPNVTVVIPFLVIEITPRRK
jgi:hypothetical protein|tara:strand:- start:2747 stop:3079 length:333 start_codon:yes stop_codon:yes gene_type:complete